MNPDHIRVMIVDDSAAIRGLLRTLLEQMPDMSVCETAINGRDALNKISRMPADKLPDIVLMDVVMPEMDGLTAVREIHALHPKMRLLVLSSDVNSAVDALARGASSFIEKPGSRGDARNTAEFEAELVSKIRRLCGKADYAQTDADIRLRPVPVFVRPQVLAIGSSTGGLQALLDVLTPLRAQINIPVVITQHMTASFMGMLADSVAQKTGIPTHEAADNMRLQAGHAYIAPGHRHMTLAREQDGVFVKLDNGPPENFCKPAVDPMMRSLQGVYGRGVIAVILTGMGSDGLEGIRGLSAEENIIMAQDQASSVVWGMPGALAKAGFCNFILPPAGIAQKISEYLPYAAI